MCIFTYCVSRENRSIQDAPYSALCYIRSEADDDEIGLKKHEVRSIRCNVLLIIYRSSFHQFRHGIQRRNNGFYACNVQFKRPCM